MITDGITINNKHSYTDFDLYISDKTIDLPEKELITDTVPFMSGFYDFSNILGEIVFKQRIISYTFDLVATSSKTLEELKTEVLMWLMNVHNVDIYDDSLTDYHFRGSYSEFSWSEDDFEHGELTINFLVQPFKIADDETEIVLESGDNTITYDGMQVNIYAVATASTSIVIGSSTVSVGTTKAMLSIPLTNAGLTISYSGSDTVTISYRKEVI